MINAKSVKNYKGWELIKYVVECHHSQLGKTKGTNVRLDCTLSLFF